MVCVVIVCELANYRKRAGFLVSECATQAEVNKHLELGKDFLARGQLADALTHYHAAVGKFG